MAASRSNRAVQVDWAQAIRPAVHVEEVGEPQVPVRSGGDVLRWLDEPEPEKVVITPAGVIRPIELVLPLVNHTFPSGPPTIPSGDLTAGSV